MSVDAAVVKNEDKYIPTIDLRDYFDAYSEEKRAKVIEQVRTACLEHGFFQVEGHGVPVESQRRMFAACKALFDLPLEKKRRISLYKYSWRRGYEGPGEQQANDPHHGDFERDAKEGFFVGKELPLDQVDFGKGPNVWPPDLAENDFHRPVMEYYEHARKVGFKVMELLAVSLGHPPSILKDFTTDAAMFLKLLRYPAHTWTDTRKFGSGQHTDYGGITILLQDPGQDGLEVWHEATQQWVELPALEDKFVINLGDMVQRWTGGEYKSTLHRVINKTGGERYAVPAFWHGDLDAKNPLDPNDTSDETVLEFIKKKFYKGGTSSTIERLQKLSRSIEQICEIEGVPGVSIGVLDHGETLWTESFGFRDKSKTAHPDVNTQYSIGHITMSMVAAGVGKLVDDGKLQWTKLLREIIPEIDHTGVYWTHTATIADILAHRCGLNGEVATLLADGGNGDIQPCLEEFLKAIDRIPRPLPHRESWLMSPWGYTIAAHIIEHISGQSLHEYLQDQVFRPLGMTSTTLRPSFEGSNNVAEPHASLSNGHACPLEFQPNFANTLFEGSRGAYSTVSDLLVWTKETLAASQNTAASANTVLKQIPHIISNHIAMKYPSLLERSYGFGWARTQLPGVVGLLGGNSGLWEMSEQPIFGAGNQSRLMIYHQGGGPGCSSFVAIFPETQSAVVVLMNTTAVSDAADWISRLLIEGLFDFAKPTDYVRLAEEGKRRTIERFATLHNRLAEERIQGAPPLPLKCYVGKYENKVYKYRLEVTLSPESESNLMISFRDLDSQPYPLRHYHDHVFEWSMSFDGVRKSGRYDITDPSYYKIRFEIYPDNRASRIIWNIHDASVPGGLTFEWKDERLAEAWRAVHADIVTAKTLI